MALSKSLTPIRSEALVITYHISVMVCSYYTSFTVHFQHYVKNILYVKLPLPYFNKKKRRCSLNMVCTLSTCILLFRKPS